MAPESAADGRKRSEEERWREMRATYTSCGLVGIISDAFEDIRGQGAGTYFIFVILVYYAIGVLPTIPVVLPILAFTEVSSRLLWFLPLVLGLVVGRGILPYLCKRQVRAHRASAEGETR